MTTGLILAGGTSSRFEFGDKALYQDFPERCFSSLSNLTETIFVSAKLSNLTELKKRLPEAHFVVDVAPYIGQGPLAALYAFSVKFDRKLDVLLLSVDNPELSENSLKKLLAQPNAYASDYFTVAHLTFEAAQLADFLATGQRRMKAFLDLLEAQPIDLPPEELIDHNKK